MCLSVNVAQYVPEFKCLFFSPLLSSVQSKLQNQIHSGPYLWHPVSPATSHCVQHSVWGEKPHAFPWCWALSKEGMATSNSLQAQRRRNKGTVTYMYRVEGAPSQKNSRLKIHAPQDTDISKAEVLSLLVDFAI